MPTKRIFGNIRKLPSGRWQARFTAPDGTTVKAPTTFATKARASDWLALQHADLIRHDWVDPALGSLALREYASAWLADRSDLRPSTRALYADHIRRFITGPYPQLDASTVNPFLGDLTLRQITTKHVAHWHRWVKEVSAAGVQQRQQVTEGSARWNRALRAWARVVGTPIATTGRIPHDVRVSWITAGCPGLDGAPAQHEVGATQAAQAYRTLHAIFASAQREGRIPKNPCTIKGAGQSRTPKRRPATEAQVQAIAEAMPPRYASAVAVAPWGALRAGEVFALSRRHVDLGTGAVRVERTLLRSVGDGPRFGPPKTEAGIRVVHLPPCRGRPPEEAHGHAHSHGARRAHLRHQQRDTALLVEPNRNVPAGSSTGRAQRPALPRPPPHGSHTRGGGRCQYSSADAPPGAQHASSVADLSACLRRV